MTLNQTIDNDLNQALKEKNQVVLGTLRMLKSAIKNQAIADRLSELDDQAVQVVIRRELKKRQDSIESFKAGNRPDLVAKEEAEVDILAKYLPAMMTEDEVAKIVEEVIASGANNFGQAMKETMAKTVGRADGKLVQDLVKQKLNIN